MFSHLISNFCLVGSFSDFAQSILLISDIWFIWFIPLGAIIPVWSKTKFTISATKSDKVYCLVPSVPVHSSIFNKINITHYSLTIALNSLHDDHKAKNLFIKE